MKWFLYFMSLYLMLAGTIFILYTSWLKNLLQKLLHGPNLRWLFPLPLLIGALFIGSKDLLPYPFAALFLGILLLGLLERRFWCRHLCPLGAMLDLLSRFPLLRRTVKDGG